MPFEDLSGTVVRKICMACSREFSGFETCPHDGHTLVVLPGSQDQWIGRRLKDYRIQKILGTGGMGVVYLAWHELMERWVAVKMLKSAFIQDRASVVRFQQEAKLASKLKHPNVITLHDFGVTDTQQPFMVMDYLVGVDEKQKHLRARSFAQEIKDSKNNLPIERIIHIVAQACDALDHAHKQGVIHRDVKPANIMIVPTEDDEDFVKVVDFGVAKLIPLNNAGDSEVQSLTQAGEVCGSPVYMSPEQCQGQPLDRRADIYSMGVVLYEAITGRLPLLGKNMVETMSKHIHEKPLPFKDVRPDLYLPPRVEQIVMQALEKRADARQQSMAQLAQDLRFSIPRANQAPNLRSSDTLAPPSEERGTPKWLIPVLIGVAAIAVIGGGAAMMMNKPKPVQSVTPVVAPPPVKQTLADPPAVKEPPPKVIVKEKEVIKYVKVPVVVKPPRVHSSSSRTARPVASSSSSSGTRRINDAPFAELKKSYE